MGRLAEIGSLFRLQSAIVWFMRGATAGLALDAATLLVARYRAFTPQTWQLALVPGGLAIVGLVIGLMQRYSAQLVAARTDRNLALKERVTTALELRAAPADRASGALAQAQIADAMWHVRRIEPWRAFPPHLPGREGRAIALAALATAALIAIPNPGKQAIQRQAVVSNAIKVEAQKLQKTATEIKQNEDQTGNHSQDQQNIDQILTELQKQLRQPVMSAEDALAKLQSAQQKLQANQDANADPLAEALQALAANFEDQPLLQKVAQDIRNGDYSAAAQDLNAAGQQSSALSQEQRDSLAASLRAAAAAQAKAGNSQLSDSLGQASDSLNGSSADTSGAFRQVSGNLQNAGQRSQAQQNLSKALSQVQQSADSLVRETGEGQASQGGSSSSFNSGGQDSLDQSGSGMGAGSGANGREGGNQGQGQGSGQGSDSMGDGRGSGGQSGETIYDGQTARLEGVPGQQGQSGKVSTSDDDSLADPASNGSNVPYEQVVGRYQQQASQAMDRAAVPLSYRQIVKDYFSSLAPRR
jgi:hypothetical protein